MRIEWRGASCDVREAGSGPALILVHGYPLDGAMWSGVARTLAARFRVLKPDLPGRGENPAAASGDIDGHADFLEALAEGSALPRRSRRFLDGRLRDARAPAARSGERPRGSRSSTRGPRPTTRRAQKRRDEAIATVRSEGVAKIADGMVPRLLSEAALGNRDLVERVRRVILRQKPETVESDLSAMRGRSRFDRPARGLGRPALVLVGEKDALTPPALSEKLAAAIPGAKLVTIPGAGHLDADGEAGRRRGGARRLLRRRARLRRPGFA